MKLWDMIVARRQRKVHERHERERARQKALAAQEPQEAVREVATSMGVRQQGMFGDGSG
jgi:hypothetical protein